MKQKIRHIANLLMLAALTVACSTDSYPGLEYEYPTASDAVNSETGNPGGELGTRLRVLVSNSSFYSTPAVANTRGTGPFNVPITNRADSNHYAKSIFHLFAFRDRPDEQGPLAYMPDYTRRASDAGDANVNCLVDGYDYYQGLPAHLNKNQTGEFVMLKPDLANDTTLHFGDRFSDIGYNFYAYYLDDATVTQSRRDPDRIYYDIDIDGSQDIMVGRSQRLTPEILDERYPNIELTQEQRDHVLNIGNYSSYASMLGVQPIVDMRHLLARLQFRAYPADASCDSVFIDSISIESRHKARFTVAAINAADIGLEIDAHRDSLWLKGADPDKNDPDSVGIYPLEQLKVLGNTVQWKPEQANRDLYERDYVHVGSDLLVMPDTAYTMTLHYSQILRDGTDRRHTFKGTFNLPAPEIDINWDADAGEWRFKPGLIYYVRIAVYGSMPITVDVAISDDGWQDGGDVDVDVDQ